MFMIQDEEAAAAPIVNDEPNDAYACISCSYPIEILRINDSDNTITFKCLNPNDKEALKTLSISEYLDSMKKYTYLYNECSLCHNKQNEFKDAPIFLYCIKCNAIICPECTEKHLNLNVKNHPNLSSKYLIKNNEKNIKCLLHPKEKNVGFCFDCNAHICNECMKSQKHRTHTQSILSKVSVTDELKNILNYIINIYK